MIARWSSKQDIRSKLGAWSSGAFPGDTWQTGWIGINIDTIVFARVVEFRIAVKANGYWTVEIDPCFHVIVNIRTANPMEFVV